MPSLPKSLIPSFNAATMERQGNTPLTTLQVLENCQRDMIDAINCVRAYQMRANIPREKIAKTYEETREMDYLRVAIAREVQSLTQYAR